MRRFAEDLEREGIAVTKVNFHAGDVLFFPRKDAIAYRGTFEEWPRFVRELIEERGIDAVFLFGDCRPLHRDAIREAEALGARVWAFEEGYLRPDWITLEEHGVNGHSRMPRDPAFYRSLELPEPEPPVPVGPSFGLSAWYSTLNALAFTHLSHGFRHYVHHRNLNAWYQTGSWVRGYFRKRLFAIREREWIDRLAGPLSKKFFFVPLQVHCDFQIKHSPYAAIEDFVVDVVRSFEEHAPRELSIVFKHHPMDRPYRDYTSFFADLAERHGLRERLVYVHDLDLPTLLAHSLGTVTINSTVGLASIQSGTPAKVMGTAVYDMPGLTFQGSLEEFWRDQGAIDRDLCETFRRYLLATNQVNGNFYKPLPGTKRGAGLRLFEGLER
jgi:capsule polysaccharide modification protein KpsS